MVVSKIGDLNPAVLQDILRHSLADSSIQVTGVNVQKGLGGINDNYASDLSKIVVTVEEGGKQRKLHLVVKAALQSASAWASVIFGLFIFYRETFWFGTALPELVKLVSEEQGAALLEVNPKVHYAYCNYDQDNRGGCLLSRALTCCCCVLMCKSKEKGIIMMENLKDGGEDMYVDLKEIERTSGGGVKTAHMRMILEGLAHFHGAWMVWMRSREGMGDMSREQMEQFFKQQGILLYRWKWIWKLAIKKSMNYYTVLAETKNEQNVKEKIVAFNNSPGSVDRYMKTFDYKDSKFKTMCHSDLWTSQIMFALHEDGTPKRVKILDYQSLTFGHPALDIWSIIYSATDSAYRGDHMEDDLRAYYSILEGYMDTQADYTEFRLELEERRVLGMVLYGTFCMVSLSPTPLPSPTKETSKFEAAMLAMLTAEETEEDHPDLKEIRRRVMSNMKEMVDLDLIHV